MYESIAERIAPQGAELSCPTCNKLDKITRSKVAEYLATGWPACCGHTMTFNGSAHRGPGAKP